MEFGLLGGGKDGVGFVSEISVFQGRIILWKGTIFEN